MKAVIVAAGKSSRLYPRTLEIPKTLLPLGNQTILDRSLGLLNNLGITDIAIVTGYKSEVIENYVNEKCTILYNPFFAHCNNAGSLWMAKEFIDESPFIYLHADIVYDQRILSETLSQFISGNSDYELVVDFDKELTEESMKVKVSSQRILIESNKELEISEAHGEWTGIAYINKAKELFKNIEHSLRNDDLNKYDTHTFSKMAAQGASFQCVPTNMHKWLEIDFEEEYQEAIKTFK